jgi:hypothetical protein
MTMLTSKPLFKMNFLLEKNIGYLHEILWKINVLWEKGDETTRFDGT